MKINRFYRRLSGSLIKTDELDIIINGYQDIYLEGDKIDILNLTQERNISVNKILRSNNSLRMSEKDNRLILTIYPNTNKKRILKKVGTDNQGRPVLKFNDLWLRLPEELFNLQGLNYLHSLNKEYNELITMDLDNYRVVFHKTRFNYPDIIVYKKGQDNNVKDKEDTNR